MKSKVRRPCARSAFAWRSWRRFSPTTLTPAAISASVSSAGHVLPGQHQLHGARRATRPGRRLVEALARLPERGAQGVRVHQPPPPTRRRRVARRRRRGGTRRSAPARTTCTRGPRWTASGGTPADSEGDRR